jgi:hypothetical protein
MHYVRRYGTKKVGSIMGHWKKNEKKYHGMCKYDIHNGPLFHKPTRKSHRKMNEI